MFRGNPKSEKKTPKVCGLWFGKFDHYFVFFFSANFCSELKYGLCGIEFVTAVFSDLTKAVVTRSRGEFHPGLK